jgi:hypothetical protein
MEIEPIAYRLLLSGNSGSESPMALPLRVVLVLMPMPYAITYAYAYAISCALIAYAWEWKFAARPPRAPRRKSAGGRRGWQSVCRGASAPPEPVGCRVAPGSASYTLHCLVVATCYLELGATCFVFWAVLGGGGGGGGAGRRSRRP